MQPNDPLVGLMAAMMPVMRRPMMARTLVMIMVRKVAPMYQLVAGSAFGRAGWAPDDGVALDFTWTVRGGVWTQAHVGVPVGSLRGSAAHADARGFCALFGLGESATFSLARYGREAAFVLVKAWCHKVQWWYKRYLREGEGIDLSAAAASGYEEPPDVAEVFATASQRVRDRIESMRALRLHLQPA